jgi:hypothetical protein
VEKYGRAGQTTNGVWRMRIARCITKTTDAHWRMCNSFSTAKMVARMRLSVTLYAHCLSCSQL